MVEEVQQMQSFSPLEIPVGPERTTDNGVGSIAAIKASSLLKVGHFND
jgi:hypothetical protein